MNVAMGAAYPSGDPDFPLTYKCELTAKECDRPVRLEGIPISWGSIVPGYYKQKGEWSYRVNFNFEPTPETLIYMGATTSYRAGGWNMGGPDNRANIDTTGDGVSDTNFLLQYQGEDLVAFEIGYKGTHMDGRMQVNLSMYTYDYSNYQDQVERWEDSPNDFSINAVGPDGFQIAGPAGRGAVDVVENIPSAVNKGFEFDVLFLATDNFTIGANGSYTEATYNSPYTFFNEEDPRYPRDVFGGDLQENPCNASPELRALYCIEVNGYSLQGIPKEKFTVWGNYSWPLERGMLTWYAAFALTGEYSTHAFNRPWDIVPQRERLDTRLTYEEETGQWEASVFVDNVFDDTYLRSSDMDSRRTGYGGNWPQRVVSLYPRYIGAEFTYNFNR
jgi:iron complex outermembrane receptor protein